MASLARSTGRRLSFGLLAAALAVSGCATEVGGRALAGGAADEQSPAARAPAPSGDPVAEPGQCVLGSSPAPVDCAKPHHVEVTKAGTFGADLPAARPDAAVIFKAALPECRTEAAKFLGSTDFDASTLAAWMLWAPVDDWAAGDRWYRCGVAQLDPDGKAVERTGSLKGALSGEKFFEFQVCSSVKPLEAAVKRISCTEPHHAEGLRVVTMGKPGDPVPTPDEFNAAARPVCGETLTKYLGTATRDDVVATWRWPSQTEWEQGFTNLTCYAQTDVPVTKKLRNLGAAPLPVG
ncbi:septum formation family protein [Amycolatopsis magusensis]|uniref:septum formation family protein n=1 Tax=Amycolatopsis magusensis TaxID=882444 RepID=UPI0024A7D221|nr:septum formation family protein [Amycolatopsis magusensis]MDI5982224.1 septum formation family protein [Amycolatopsis magusensis]